MKVRIGIGLGVRTELNGPDFLTVVDELERLKFDSLWLSERINGPAPDPLIASAAAPRGYARIRRHDLFKCDVAADDFV